jgi:hypothetical protein
MERADAALYAAKRSGRNCVVRADQMPEGLPPAPARADQIASIPQGTSEPIPFPVVTALMTALQHRDLGTAAHCRRVADLCVLMSRGLLQTRDIFVLEVAALLHDIGKIGVPDAILLKRFIDVVSARDEHRQANGLSPLQERWAQLSVEVERLASAVDARDIESVNAVAHHLGQTAAKMEMPAIAKLAVRLHEASTVERDLSKVLEGVNEMLALCVAAQEKILSPDSTSPAHDPALRSTSEPASESCETAL